jgi:diacylglycerol kinase
MLAVAGCTIGAGALLRVTLTEWRLLLIAVFVVLIAEVINTAIEFLTDLASPEHHPLAAKAKDAAAGAVLLAAVLAFLIGVLVLGPKLVAALGIR